MNLRLAIGASNNILLSMIGRDLFILKTSQFIYVKTAFYRLLFQGLNLASGPARRLKSRLSQAQRRDGLKSFWHRG